MNIEENELDFSFETNVNSFIINKIFYNGYQYNDDIWVFNNYYKYNYNIPIKFKFYDTTYDINLNITDKRYSIITTIPNLYRNNYLENNYWFSFLTFNGVEYNSFLDINYENRFEITDEITDLNLDLILSNITNFISSNLKYKYEIPENFIITFSNILPFSQYYDSSYVYSDYYQIIGNSNIEFNTNIYQYVKTDPHGIYFEIYIENNRISDFLYNNDIHNFWKEPYLPHIIIYDNR